MKNGNAWKSKILMFRIHILKVRFNSDNHNIDNSIWKALDFWNISFFSTSGLDRWLGHNSCGPNASLFLTGFWWNWRDRNIVCVGNERIHIFHLQLKVKRLATLISICFPVLIVALKPPTWVSWHPSRVDEFILNVDGSCLGDMGKAGFGGLIRKGMIVRLLASLGFLKIFLMNLWQYIVVWRWLKISDTIV